MSTFRKIDPEHERGMLVHIVFDGPPGPTPGRFVEVETADGKSFSLGRWIELEDGYWGLGITVLATAELAREVDA